MNFGCRFFKKYIQTIASCDDPREWNRLLFNIVPTAFTPSVGIIVRDIVPSLVGKGAFFCLPKLWEVLKLTGYAEKLVILRRYWIRSFWLSRYKTVFEANSKFFRVRENRFFKIIYFSILKYFLMFWYVLNLNSSSLHLLLF